MSQDVANDLGAVLDTVKEKEARLSSMFRALVEKSSDIILITGPDLVIKYITGSVEMSLGVKQEAVLGEHLLNFVPLEKVKALQAFVSGNVVTEDQVGEIDFVTTTGKRKFFDVTVSNLLANHKVNGLVVNLHEITKRKLTEEKLVKANNELDHFIYKTSHDLRAPLLSAIGLVELASNDPERDKYDYLMMIKQSLKKLDNFIEDINAFYRNEKLAIRKEQVYLREVIAEEIQNLGGAESTSGIDINFNLTEDAELFSDALRVRTVITNILSNAIKYSDHSKTSSYIDIEVAVTRDECKIEVSDNGIGIREKYLNNIFDIFYRADENAKGSGLGLYIVKDTVDKLNGQVRVTSEYGKGTAFTILIPNFLNAMEKLGRE